MGDSLKILVLGKGNSGEGCHRFLNHMGIEHDYLTTDEVSNFDYQLVVKSPGISYQNETVRKLKHVKIITDIELIGILLNRDFIGVTGTNGKTTTVTLINHIMKSKYKSIACGNIGTSICDAALTDNKVFVVELSSFQLCGVKTFAPHVAVILNMNLAHLDYHKSKETYFEAKTKFLLNQRKEDYLIYNGDDLNVCKYIRGNAKRISFGLKESNDYYLKNGYLYHKKKRIIPVDNNFSTAKMCAIIVCLLYGISKFKIRQRIKTYPRLKYRQEVIAKNIINDAKSTNPNATLEVVKQHENIILLCGGLDRNEDLNVLNDVLWRINKVYAYGQTKDKIKTYMDKNNIYCETYNKISECVEKINLNKNEVLLYSPMMASWDQYKSYEQRGAEFTQLIHKKNTSISTREN